ncbi:MAG: formimidoylglutamate deiminase [Actinophytocola sp.]|nr:formimidoylglutamate deiminase [Actinophytocola sp.]
MNTYWCEHAWLPDGPAESVAITVDGERIVSVERDAPKTGTVLDGMVTPGFANVHSHAFHRALRGRTHGDGGTFWTWRDRMYAVAERLDPESYYRLARAVYAEMALAGYTSVGEFHYLHHGPRGARYDDPNAMSHALAAAAADAGIRLTLLDTCYLTASVDGGALDAVQQRFSDGDADAWASRLDAFKPEQRLVRVGAAVHSVRAVPAEQIPTVAGWADGREAPLHAHVSEQRAENDACLTVHGTTPTALLAKAGALGERFVGVHATHLTDKDIGLLGSVEAGACFCPTTERDLGDGIGSGGDLAAAGVRLSLGSDSQAVIDPFEELRGLEMDERLAHESRGHFDPVELMAAATRHSAIGWDGLGELVPGAAADLVRIARDSVRTTGSEPLGVPLCATAADVRDVMVAGRWLVRDGRHQSFDDHAAAPATELATEIESLLA